jgi:predicted peptidase
MIEMLNKAGGNPRYTEYPGVGHNSWDRAYAEPELLSWLFSQKKVG